MDAQRGQIRGSALLMFGRVIALLIGMATQVILVRTLSKEDFGAFAYALALASGARVLLSLGQGRLLSRFLATYEEQRDYPRMLGAMLLAVGTILVTSCVAISGLYLFSNAVLGSAVEGEDAVNLMLILIFLSPLEALDQVFVSIFAVFSKPRAIFFRKHLLAPLLRFVVVLALALTGAGVTFVAVGYVLAGVAGLVLYVVLLINMIRQRGLLREFRQGGVVVPYRAVFEFSVPQITGELTLLSMTVAGVAVLGFYHSTVEVADYRAVFSAARLNTAITSSFSTLFLPVIARFYARGDIDGLRQSYWHTAVFVAVLTFPIFAMTVPFASATTVALFGEKYAEAGPVMLTLALGYYVSAILGFNAYVLQVCERIRFLVGVNVFAAVLNVGLCLLLAPRFAAVGVAAAHTTVMVTQNLLNQWALRGAISTRFLGSGYRRCYAWIAGVTVALGVIQVVFSPGIVLACLVAGVAFLLVLVGTRRELKLGETFPELQRIPVVRRLVGR